MKLFVACLSALYLGCVASSASATPTENLGLRVLPAPGKVVVDGKADDWDLSGGIFACDDVETQRATMGVWFHAMYDAKNLYILAHFLDETPMNNPGQTIADYGFAGDSLQWRTITAAGGPHERGQHFTAWHGRDGRDVIKVEQGKDFKEGVIEDAKSHDGAEQAFSKDVDGKGYTQEIAIPWKLLTRDGRPLLAGDTFRITVEPNFTVGNKGRFSVKDIFKPGVTPDRVFTFMASACWGTATLEAKGSLPPAPVRLADAREFAVKMEGGRPVVHWDGLIKSKDLPGSIPVAFDMPFDGFVSLNITGPSGAVARQLLTCAYYSKGHHTVKWDGLETWSWTRPGEPVAPGAYRSSAIAHQGLGLRLRGWADNGGKTPWDSEDGRGNWGGDHGLPCAVATDAKQVYLGWNGAEAGKSLLAVDLDGHVLWSNNRAGISGVKSLAVDQGVLYVLGGSAGADADGANLYKLATKTGNYVKWDNSEIADLKIASLWPASSAEKPSKADAISIKDGQIQLAFAKANVTLVVDPHQGKWIKTIPGVTDLRLTSQAISGDGVLCTWKGEPDNQIVVTKEGQVVQTIGRHGGRALLGPWQADGLRSVANMAVDAAGKLWVAEADLAPKRISVWDLKTGKLVHEFFGSSGYGALGGAIDPLDPNVMVGQGCEWRIDPQTGRARCLGVVTREEMANSRFAVGSNGRLYLAVANRWAFETGTVRIFERLGAAQYKLRCAFRYEGKPPQAKTTLWTDANGDEQEQPDEIATVNGELRFSGWYMNLGPDLTITAGDKQLKTVGFTECGAPKYDLRNPVKLPAAGLSSADATLLLQPGSYGETHTRLNCFEIASGQRLWSYPDNFNGVHGSHNACPPALGMIRGSYGPCGAVKLPEPVGNLYVIPTNVGEWHLLTGDGFYLSRLFEGDPLQVKWPAQAIPGADMTHCPPGMGGEDFGGSATLGKDGKLYLQAGKTAFWNLEVTGLDTVVRIPGGMLKVDAHDQQVARQFREEQLQASAGKKRLVIKAATPKFTGNLEQDFKGAEIISFKKQDENPVRAAATWDDHHLYVAWEVKDSTPWVNGATDETAMYLGGDTVDLQLGTNPAANPQRTAAEAGDLRLSIGNFQGKPTSVVYRKISQTKRPAIFSSGVIKSYPLEFAAVVSGVDVKVTIAAKSGYTIEAAIPLSVLEFTPQAGLHLRGDLGVTHGDPAGRRTRLRTYWSNQHTGIVDDAVFELMLEPAHWGELSFEK
ncbi:MAG TPA: hypothetical protein VFE24_16935 [Pirellulales bacterium]|jgi:hypothetical protein|nr:hypothetical protein [Pirellulales bacterium]